LNSAWAEPVKASVAASATERIVFIVSSLEMPPGWQFESCVILGRDSYSGRLQLQRNRFVIMKKVYFTRHMQMMPT
jgi:hypothetical protein